MAEGVQIAAFEGGQLRVMANGATSHEAVLALPLSRLIVKMVRVPAENRDDPVAFVAPILQAMSPYPDEPLTIGLETVQDDERGLIVIAAALPESATDDIGEALDAAKLNVTRVDALAIGALRGLWHAIGTSDGARRVVLLDSVDCISIIVLDGESPSAIRAVNAASALKREMTLSLLEAEDFGGAQELKEIVVVAGEGSFDLSPLEAFAPVRRISIGDDAALVGVAERTNDPDALNALPDSWREMLEESRFKAKLKSRLAVAGGFWVLLLAIIFGVPFAYDKMADHQTQLCKDHGRQYREVKDMVSKVKLVQKYSDHACGALEIMKAVSDRLPAGITLDNWSFRRETGDEGDEGVHVEVSGEAEKASDVYEFQDAIRAIIVTGEDGEETALFKTVNLTGPTSTKGGKQKFSLKFSEAAEVTE